MATDGEDNDDDEDEERLTIRTSEVKTRNDAGTRLGLSLGKGEVTQS